MFVTVAFINPQRGIYIFTLLGKGALVMLHYFQISTFAEVCGVVAELKRLQV